LNGETQNAAAGAIQQLGAQQEEGEGQQATVYAPLQAKSECLLKSGFSSPLPTSKSQQNNTVTVDITCHTVALLTAVLWQHKISH
jgi:hypothetical protein